MEKNKQNRTWKLALCKASRHVQGLCGGLLSCRIGSSWDFVSKYSLGTAFPFFSAGEERYGAANQHRGAKRLPRSESKEHKSACISALWQFHHKVLENNFSASPT